MVAPNELTEAQRAAIREMATELFEYCQWLVSAVDTFNGLEPSEKEIVCHWPGHAEAKKLIEQVKKVKV